MNRHRYLSVLATVSCVALMSFATATQAVQPSPVKMGTLTAKENWKVGMVETKGAPYCAMLGRFESDVVLAFARNTDGLGSLAVDFRDALFSPGLEYEVTLTPGRGKPRVFTAEATGEKSIVVQIGQDDAFYDTLGKGGALAVATPVADVSFKLAKFSSSYNDLVACSSTLGGAGKPGDMQAVKVAPVETAALDTAAEIVWEESGAAQAAAQTETPAPATTPGRKLLASAQAPANAGLAAAGEARKPLPSVPLSAQALDRQQAAYLQQAVREKQGQIAVLEAAKARDTEKQVEAFSLRRQELDAKTADLQKQRDAIVATRSVSSTPVAADEAAAVTTTTSAADRAAKTAVVAKQAEIANVDRQRVAETAALDNKLAALHADYGRRITALESERDGLKQQLESAATEGTRRASVDARHLRDMQMKLVQSEQDKLELSERLVSLEKQNSLMQAALAGKEKQLTASESSAQTAAELAAVKADLAKVNASHQKTVSALQQELAAKSAQYVTLEQQLAQLRAGQAVAGEAQGTVALLERQLREMDTARAAEAERAASAAQALEAAQREIAQLRQAAAESASAAAAAQAANIAATQAANANAAQAEQLRLAQAEIQRLRAETASLQNALAGVRAAPQNAARVSAAASADPRLAPVTSYQPQRKPAQIPASAPVVVSDPDGNRAAAFLDRVMKHHRPGGDKSSEVSPRIETRDLNDIEAAAGDSNGPVARFLADAPRGYSGHNTGLSRSSAPAASDNNVAARVAASIAASRRDVEPAFAAQPSSAPVSAVSSAVRQPMTLETLLARAGVSRASFVAPASPQETLRQWTSGPISGMHEWMPAGAAFDKAVGDYLARYLEDCPQALQTNRGAAQSGVAGTFAAADVSCTDPANAYTTSFLFLQDGATFHAVLHSARPAEADRVRNIAAGLSQAVASGVVISSAAPAAVTTASLSPTGAGAETFPAPVTSQAAQFDLRRPAASASFAARPGDEFETVIIQ